MSGRIRVEEGHKRVRAMLGGVVVADSTRPRLVWEVPYYPTYYFHPEDVKIDLVVETGEVKRSPSRGNASMLRVEAGAGVDILRSSRNVRVEINGTTVADSHSPSVLFETGLPTRFYLPRPT